MSDFGEFGYAESGPRVAQLDYDKQISELMGNTKTAAELPEIGARTQLYGAQARLEGAKANQAELEAAAMGKVRDALAAKAGVPSSGASNDPNYNPGYDIAKVMYDNGAINAGAKALEQATKIDEQRANMARYRGVAGHEEALTAKMHVERVAGMAQGALQDQTAYNNFLMQAPSLGYNVNSFPQDLESARPILQNLVNQGMTASQQITVAQSAQRIKDAQEAQVLKNRVDNARIGALSAQEEYTKVRKADLEKNGGPRAEATIEASRELLRIRQERVKAEQLKTQGKTPDNPLSIPLKDGKPDAGKLNAGSFYSNGKQVGKWDGKNMILVPGAKPVELRSAAPVDNSEIPDATGE